MPFLTTVAIINIGILNVMVLWETRRTGQIAAEMSKYYLLFVGSVSHIQKVTPMLFKEE